MKSISVKFKEKKYNIYIGKDAVNILEKYVEKYEKILVLSNEVVGKLYKKDIVSKIEKFQKIHKDKIYYFEIPDGEQYKNYQTAESVYDFLVENEFYRNTLIITLGGGVVTDLGGYVAATYMRGVDYIQIPTTLLAQVDASIGGKVAINHKNSKNIIGAFYQPKAVIINPEFLGTLPQEHFKSGLGEIIKHSLISKDSNHIQWLEKNYEKINSRDYEILENTIKDSCEIKKNIVELDETEKGERVFLNLGHTYAHALESIYQLKNISHGESVAKGIFFEIILFDTLSEKEIKRVEELFGKFNIDYKTVTLNSEILLKELKKDKKNSGEGISFIKMESIGRLKLKKVSESEIERVNRVINEKYAREVRGVIDVGTNSTRLFLSEIEKNIGDKSNGVENKIARPLLKLVEITSLGKGVDKNRVLSQDAIKRTVDCIKEFRKIAQEYGAVRVNAYATSAVRDAGNRDEFMQEVEKQGVKIQCISGEIEAKLSFVGISSQCENENIGIIDIGGGSTEVSIGHQNEIHYSKSFDVGAVRVTEMFFQKKSSSGEIIEDYSNETIEKAKEWIKLQFEELKKFHEKEMKIFGVAGTVSKQVTILEEMDTYDADKVHGYELKLEDIKKNYELLVRKSLEERKKIKGLEPKRAEYVIAGTIILIILLENIFKKDKVIFSEVDNLEGATIYFK